MKLSYFCCLLLLLFSCQESENPHLLFTSLSSSETGIQFANILTETEQENILNYEYFYNGGGVGVGDFNNDGLQDLFFTANQTANQLYVNKGSLKFEDISQKAGIEGRKNAWKTGVSLVDINADGWLDIYVCYSGNKSIELRKNQLFINNHNLTFSEKAEEYGLADAGYSTQAVFFDYDNDGDLDCFVLNHNLRDYERNPSAEVMRNKRDEFAGDKLFRNDDLKFTEVSQQVGIKSNPLGFGLGVVAADINQDNKPDLYVGNDYVEDDYLYVNHGNGLLKDVLREKLNHTSRFTMGVEIADINNDTLPDIFTLDMLPEDNYRQKLLTFPDNWNNYQSMLDNGFWHQNMRNMLHLNNGNGSFSEIGQLAGVSNTDWSWAALFADFDNDGLKDLFVSNGELKDLTNSDFIKYAADEEMKKSSGMPSESLINQIKHMSSSATRNYIFRNIDGIHFENKQKEWGFNKPGVANGAVYADLDNDGDLEIITNNLNEEAKIYKNNSTEQKSGEKLEQKNNFYLKIKLKGSSKNPFGIGAKVLVYSGNKTQYQEFMPVRGFQSSICDNLHFGLGNEAKSVKVKVIWQDGKQQILENVKPGQTLEINYQNAVTIQKNSQKAILLFEESARLKTDTLMKSYQSDFDKQILLPYQYSRTGSKIASGDVNNDGLEDFYGRVGQTGQLWLQQREGSFKNMTSFSAEDKNIKDAVFFDADNDKDLDLYVVIGNYGSPKNAENQQDKLYLNDGKGNFKLRNDAIPQEFVNNSCVKVFDIDNDGDKDLFAGGGVKPFNFPLEEKSYVLVNDGKGKFSLSQEFSLGLVTDIAIDDIDKNGFPDVLAVGEWMAPQVLLNKNGKLQEPHTIQLNEPINLNGWWNRIAASDLDNDGDLDFVVGNLGLNCQMKPSEKEPVTLLYDDFDNNGSIDPLLCYYIQGVSYPAAGRDETLEQVVTLRKKFISYESFSKATIEDFFPENQLKNAKRLRMDFTETIILENTGKDFKVHRLPVQAQYAPVYAISVQDFDGNGTKDILLAGNNAEFRLRIGKMDANNGILLSGKGNFHFDYVPQTISGFNLRGDVKDVCFINDNLLFFMNDNSVKIYNRKIAGK
jgi:hypothetical protein